MRLGLWPRRTFRPTSNSLALSFSSPIQVGLADKPYTHVNFKIGKLLVYCRCRRLNSSIWQIRTIGFFTNLSSRIADFRQTVHGLIRVTTSNIPYAVPPKSGPGVSARKATLATATKQSKYMISCIFIAVQVEAKWFRLG